MAVKLTEITMERQLPPGSILDLEYDLIVTNTYMVAAWLKGMEKQLEKEYPLWRYLGYTWEPDTTKVTFHMKLGMYVQNVNTKEIVAWNPETKSYDEPPVTMYYASGNFIKVAFTVAAAYVATVTWLSLREVRLREEAQTEQIKAIMADPNLSDEKKAAAINALEPADKYGVRAVATSVGFVALAVIALVLWKAFE